MRPHIKRIFLFAVLIVIFVSVFILVTNIIIHTTTGAYIFDRNENIPESQVVIIPGAAILKSGALSSIFIDRVDVAIELYQTHKVKKILVSGDNSTVSHNEVNPVRNYLLEKGIPDKDIFLDHAGFDTYSTMYRARDVFGVTSALVVSQSFHLPRAIFIARWLGIDAYGVNADIGHILLRNYLREIAADEKALLNLVFDRKPKFLGEKISIDGDARESE